MSIVGGERIDVDIFMASRALSQMSWSNNSQEGALLHKDIVCRQSDHL